MRENITGAHGAAKAAAAGVKAQESAASAALMAVGEVDPVPATARPDELMPPPMVPSASPPPKRGPAADAAAPSFEPGGAPSLAETGQTRLFALPFWQLPLLLLAWPPQNLRCPSVVKPALGAASQ